MSGKDLDSNLVIVRTAALTSKIHGLAGDLQQGVEIICTWCGVLENDDEKLIQALDKEILPTIEKLTALILSLQKEILLQDMEFQRRQEELCNAQLGGWALMKFVLGSLLYMLLPFLLIPFALLINNKFLEV
ncbi:hypothetical protein GYMLUDRAFT_250658 [Collybiopsis luxurians FD-317 M1]|uniref:Uncharacterized protein n=1 Tax=Collybiopsis luxurians FD-317 M1 TaxID=944289 RepID=A0A0D0BEP4_9AGAR|nr:hypothetical protein GYMLUDRAFT_250658 [Collybiopsis luxurians FD-317 M1]